MLCAVLWRDDLIYLLTLSSDIYIWKPMSDEYEVITSHQVEINDMVMDKEKHMLYSVSYDGFIYRTLIDENKCYRIGV